MKMITTAYPLRTICVSVISAAILSGCQISEKTPPSADVTSHASHAVYEIQFQSAQELAFHANALNADIHGYCANANSLQQAQVQWRESMARWMRLQGQERGPEVALEKSWSIQFWPDKKNTTGRKLSQLLTLEQQWDAASVEKQSIVVQGSGALEWFLYDVNSPWLTSQDGKTNSCDLVTAIADRFEQTTQEIVTAWQVNPWQHLNRDQWRSEYVNLMTNQLEYSLKKLTRPLASIGKPRPYFSESWRSGTSMVNLRNNVESLYQIYMASDDADSMNQLLRREGHAELADRIVDQFELTLSTWPTEPSLFSLLSSKEGYRTAMVQYNKIEQLKYLIHDEVAIELGVIVGFNATDGD